MKHGRLSLALTFLLLASCFTSAQQRRKIIINEDCSGPAGSNLQTLLVLIQSPQVEVLGITVVSGDQWRDEEVAHTLRLLEIIGRKAQMWQERYGQVAGLRRRLGCSLVARAVRRSNAPGRAAHDQARRRRRRSFLDSHGAQIPASGDDLRGRADDQPGARHLNRSSVP